MDLGKQFNIFDYIDHKDFNIMPIKELADYIGRYTGLEFIYNSFFKEYQAAYKNVKFSLHYDNYDTIDERNGKLFISVGYMANNKKYGAGTPCDSIEESIDAIEKYKRQNEERRRIWK